MTDENVPESQIGENIGEVETRPHDMTGDYYGNASNEYQIGTKYFEIKDLPTDEGIAVEIADSAWQKAVFAHEAPSHWMDVVPYVLLTLLLLAAAIAIAFYLKKRK
ncbi:hypothetical protein ACQCVO_12245 [Bacillus infantis]|uniref:hypothetical protein n=1 Tax=Bacillus infantis TaxID=324767 RepID=UPI003CE7A718